MARYGYRCHICSKSTEASFPIGENPARIVHSCGFEAPRYYTPVTVFRFREGFNPSVGKVIGSHKQFDEELKRASEAQTLLTGQEHNYVAVDPMDKKALGVTDVGLEEQARAWRDKGWTERKTIYG